MLSETKRPVSTNSLSDGQALTTSSEISGSPRNIFADFFFFEGPWDLRVVQRSKNEVSFGEQANSKRDCHDQFKISVYQNFGFCGNITKQNLIARCPFGIRRWPGAEAYRRLWVISWP